jgi:hypothetical protein
VRECLTGDDTITRNIDEWATHYVGLEPRSIIDHFTCDGVDQNLDFSHYTDHHPIMCVLAAGPKLGNGTEAKQDRRPWVPVIKHKDLVERFQKKIERCHTKNATHLSTLQVRERYAEVVKAISDIGILLANRTHKRDGGQKSSEQARMVTSTARMIPRIRRYESETLGSLPNPSSQRPM